MEPAASSQDRPLGRVLQLFLTFFGVLLGVVIVSTTLAVLAISDHRSAGHRAPAVTVAVEATQPVATAAAPPAAPVPTTAAPDDPVQRAQLRTNELVTRFAQSLDVAERRRLLGEIQRLAATPGVTVPNH